MEAPLLPPLKAPERAAPPRRSLASTGWPAIPLARILGVNVRLDVSWLIIFALVALSLVTTFAQAFPGTAPAAIWITALATTLVFFSSILLHELSHSLVSRARGLEVEGITLFMFGGVSQIKEEPRRPSDEFLIAVIGPLTSVALGLCFFAIGLILPAETLGRHAFGWLGRINIALAVFNMLPGLPLDGGRILRAAAWALTGNLRGATRLASFLGALLAFGLVGLGVAVVLWGGRFVEGLWLGLIGWFLFAASQRSVGQLELRDSLKRLRVEQAARSTCPKVPAAMPIDQFVDEFVFRRGGKCFFVAEDEILRGIVTLDDIRRLPRDQWPTFTVGDIMIPFAQVKSVAPSDSLLVAFERMNEESINQLPVVEGQRVVGVITRNDIFRLVARFLELTERPGAG